MKGSASYPFPFIILNIRRNNYRQINFSTSVLQMFNVLLIFLYRFIIARHKIMGAALTGVGTVLGSSPAMTAEAVVSGTYF